MYTYEGAKFYEVTPKSWDDAKRIGKTLPLSVFRGHANSEWALTTTLERAANRFNYPVEQIWKSEKYVLQAFQARAHHYLNSPPRQNELIEWLSIIQDFGGPTRLLDFTESFYIASFFALDSANETACVWAINNANLVLVAHTMEEIGLKNDKQYTFDSVEILRFAESFIANPLRREELVLRVTPPRLNERIAIQKGLFLFSFDLGKSFENNLCKTFGFPFNELQSRNAIPLPGNIETLVDSVALDLGVVKINLPKYLHKDAIRDLFSMNIDAGSLFPGLDGFARSLNYSVQFGPIPYSINIGLPGASSPNSSSIA